MYLRKLEPKDAPLMLEWMHDRSVVAHLGANFAEKTIDDCLRFISASQTDALTCILPLRMTRTNIWEPSA